MVELIITEKGVFKIPECDKCKNEMLPFELDHIEKNMWRCPYCMSKKKVKNED